MKPLFGLNFINDQTGEKTIHLAMKKTDSQLF
jgi:hypothetical protein